MDLNFVNDLLWKFGLPAIFLLTMAEGDITLLLAGVLVASGFFGGYSFLKGIGAGTLGGGAGGPQALRAGCGARASGCEYRSYLAA